MQREVGRRKATRRDCAEKISLYRYISANTKQSSVTIPQSWLRHASPLYTRGPLVQPFHLYDKPQFAAYCFIAFCAKHTGTAPADCGRLSKKQLDRLYAPGTGHAISRWPPSSFRVPAWEGGFPTAKTLTGIKHNIISRQNSRRIINVAFNAMPPLSFFIVKSIS